MSLVVGYWMVDWDELRAQRKLRGDYDRWFLDAKEKKEIRTWYDEDNKELKKWDGLENGHLWTDAGLSYDEARPGLEPSLRRRFDRFFGAFLVGERERRRYFVRESPGENTDNPFFHLSMSPETAGKYFRMGGRLPLENLRTPFEENVWIPEPEGAFISSFNSFEKYVRKWIELFCLASEKKKGLLVGVFA